MTAEERMAAEMADILARIEAKREARARLRTLRERAWLRLNPGRMPGQ